jgi:predicted MFS family arabinose efflux permease
MFFLGVGTVIIGAAAGSIGLSPYQTGLLVSAQNVGFMCAVLVAGALADSTDKARLMSAGSLILAVSFFFYYLWPAYALNLAIMAFIGVGIGTYEGTADAMLLGLHRRRQGLHVSVNHFFVTFGCLATTLYLIFLRMDWRRSMVQSAVVVLALAILFLFSRAGRGAADTTTLRDRIAFLKTQGVLAVLLALAVFACGIELGLTGLLTGFLLELRGYDQVASKIGLVLFLAGVAAGRVVLGFVSGRASLQGMVTALFAAAAVCSSVLLFVRLPFAATAFMLVLMGMSVSSLFPLLITMAGRLYRDMSGTALGIVKLGVPIGGIVIPFALSMATRAWSFQLSLGIFPVLGVTGLVILLLSGRMIRGRLGEERAAGAAASTPAGK